MKEIFIRDEGVAGEKIAVVPHGLDFKLWQASPDARERIRTEFGLNGKIVFGAVGRLYWIKDYPSLLKAFAPIAAKNGDAMLLIVGAGDREPLVKLTRGLAIEDRVVFTGPRSDMADVLAAIDVFVHSSLAESFGLVIIEALAAGKPVASTDVGVARDAIEEGINGFLVPAGNTDALRAALEKMILCRERWEEMGRESHSRACSFTAQKMVTGYEEQYLFWLAKRGKLNGATPAWHHPEG
jgi:glycosyltransferase involved in cell wall biosynthesis